MTTQSWERGGVEKKTQDRATSIPFGIRGGRQAHNSVTITYNSNVNIPMIFFSKFPDIWLTSYKSVNLLS